MSDEYREYEPPKTTYICCTCGEEHETKKEAKDCCNEVEKVIYCGTCGEDHTTREEAKDCCAFWFCGYCGGEYTIQKEAKNCCKDEE